MSAKQNIVAIQGGGLLERMASRYGLAPDVFERTVAAVSMPQKNGKPDCSREELISCLVVANEHDLNPLTKEIYFMRTKSGAIQPIVSVDGWLKKLNSHPQFDGMEFVDHLDDKGVMTACTVKIYRKDRARAVEVTEYMEECRGTSEPWRKTGRRMLRHRTLTQGARYAVGFAGVMDLDEFHQWQSGMKDVTPATPKRLTFADIPDIGEAPALPAPPSEAEANQDTSQDGVLSELERRLMEVSTPGEIRFIENEYASIIPSFDEDGRTSAIEMIESAKAGLEAAESERE